MKNHSLKSVVSLIIGLCAVCACTKFDDSALWQAINKNAADIAALKEKTNNLNSDIVALQQLVAAIQNRDYITNCTPLADGTGYTVAFNSGKSIVVRNGRNGADGKDGKDGTTPQIGVAKDTDGIYYWTLNGSWLQDAAGNKVKAEGRDGAQGATPQLKILEGYWHVSTDNGATWTNLGRATGADGQDGKDGKDGDTFFKDVIVGSDSVTFVLADGTTIVIPLCGQENTYEMVDLGLPSGLKWALCNVGATKPEEYGGYYQWGGLEDVASIELDWSNCPYHTGSSSSSGWTKYIPSGESSYWSGQGDPDNKTVLDPEDDVAHAKWGGSWRMPTDEEFRELYDNCTSESTTLNGVDGIKFTSKKNGNCIFFPVAGFRNFVKLDEVGSSGFYWSSSLNWAPYAYRMYIRLDYRGNMSHSERCFGGTVRPVYDDKVSVTGVSLSKTSLNLVVGAVNTLIATVSPSSAAEQSVSWSSNNPTVATVDAIGKVTALKTGSATITVKTTDGGYTASCQVTVVSAGPAVTEAVDLGLPSGIKWASFNLGATAPEEYGGYYQWAGLEDVTSTSIYLDWSNCPYHIGTDGNTGWTKYVPSNMSSYWSGPGSPDNKSVLDPEDDVAHVKLGGEWRMPTIEDYDELFDNCTSEWTTLNGVNGRKFTSKKNGNSIFLPAAGCRGRDYVGDAGSSGNYWSSSLRTGNPSYACYMIFGSGYVSTDYYDRRYFGHSVRPVYGERESVTGVSLSNTSLSLIVGETAALCATVSPSNAAEKSVSWSSNNSSVATVDASGIVTAVKAGSATITVKTTDGGCTATCSVTVTSGSAVPEMVDLGLPSGIKWASFNLGASNPEEFGGYYQWAGTEDVTDRSIYLYWDNCPYHTGTGPTIGWTKYVPSDKSSFWSGEGSPDNKTILDPEDDVAHINLGGKWRIPTEGEFSELKNNCTSEWTTLNGVNGRKFTSKKNGNSIFLPAAGLRDIRYLYDVGSYGHYWSSSLSTDGPNGAYVHYFNIGGVYASGSGSRCLGLSVRPVSE